MTTEKKRRRQAKITALENEITSLKAQMSHSYHFAENDLKKCSTKHAMGSAVIVTITSLSGKEIVKPVSIKDGLSDETIEALTADLVRSYELAIEFKPSGFKK